jgi:hypothetical protein
LPRRSPSPPFSSFASLASPSPFTGIPQIPPSPDFQSLIRAEATGAHPAAGHDHDGYIGSSAVVQSWNAEGQTGPEGRQDPHPSSEALSSPQRPSSAMSVDGTPDRGGKKPENKPPNVHPSKEEDMKTEVPSVAGDSQQDEKQPLQAPTNQPRMMQFSPVPSPVQIQTRRQTWYQASHLRRVSGSFTKGSGSGTPRILPLQRRQT